METIKANDMRCAVVDLMVKEKEILTDYAKNLPFLLDSSFGNNYSSIDDRISNMSREDTYNADNVELLSAGYLLGKQLVAKYIRNLKTISFSKHGYPVMISEMK